VTASPYWCTSGPPRKRDERGVNVNQRRFEVAPIGRVESPLTDPASAPKQGDEGGDHGQAARPHEAEDQGRRDPVSGAADSSAALDRALALGGRDPYVLQAAIAALHVDEPQDWPQIAALYGELARLTGSSVVELNQAVAIAEAGEVEAALALVERLELDRYHYLHATRAELLRRLDRGDDARAAYDRALKLVHSDAERRFLERRLAELGG
jgi:predicted RNA polymerase sigma factor